MRPVTLNPPYTLGDFNALLAQGKSAEVPYAEAFTVALNNGAVLYYTNAQNDFTVPPVGGTPALVTYKAAELLIEGMRFKISAGSLNNGGDPEATIEVDEADVTFTPQPTSTIDIGGNFIPWLQAVAQGAMDGAVIKRDRWFFKGPNLDPVGGMPMFYGLTASIERLGATQALIKVKSDTVLLNIQMPRNLFQPNCMYTLYDTGCGVIKATYANHAVVGASPTRVFIPWTGATTQFTLGEIEFETGPNTNVIRTIQKADTTGLWLAYPLPYLPLAGDGFVAYPGCDRTLTGGCTYFGNTARIRIFDQVPQAELAL